MSISTLVVKGTTGPIHRAILRLVPEWSSAEGLPDVFTLNSAGPGTNSLVVVTDTRLCTFIRDELHRRATDASDPIWLLHVADPTQRVADGWNLPSSVDARLLARLPSSVDARLL